ncbi:Arginine/ornithine antiporter ArcD [hydrothermal vent metagenome]|uniref:Arginine/ornithine antiporter ArcD n=1 Tax=hydrothermal vent metagenome TaxID=652676 RepID=A0A3B1EAB9_9ZZZZ
MLLFVADGLSISYNESIIYFNDNSWLHSLIHFSTSIFGQNGIALRLPFILFYISSVILLYILTKDYFVKQSDRFGSILVFMLLPGVNSAALLVSEAMIVILLTLVYLYLFQKTKTINYWFLFISLFVDNSFAIMYLALFFYSLKKRDNTLLVISLLLFGISMQIYGFDSGGHPEGYFIDTFAVYSSIMSPIVFLLFIYTLYRKSSKNKGAKDLFWYISFTAFVFSLLLSLRQKIYISDFAPYIIIATPLMIKSFMHSYRVRLPQFRQKHYLIATFASFTLILNFLVFIINKPLYLILPDPNKHFANNYHVVKELAYNLKKNKINNIVCEDKKLQLRLKFYGIIEGRKYYLTTKPDHTAYNILPIKYYDKTIKRFFIKPLK